MQEDLIPLLKDSGLPEKEARVYLALLERGQATVAQISQVSGLKRPIIYVALEALLKRGLATALPQKKISTFAAGDPSLLATRLQSTAKNFIEMLPYLQSLGKKSGRRPKISFFEEKEAIWNIYLEMTGLRGVAAITSYARFLHFFPDTTEAWLKDCERGKYRDTKTRHLVPNTPQELALGRRLAAGGHLVRATQLSETFAMDFIITQNKIAVSLIDERPFLNILESPELASSMQNIFNILWDTAQEVKC